MTSPIIGKCIICGSWVSDDSCNHRAVVDPGSYHGEVLCGKASCNRAHIRKLKKDGKANLKASLKDMNPLQKARTLKEIGFQKKDTNGYLKKEEIKKKLLKKFSKALESGNKTAFKNYFMELDTFITSISDINFQNNVVDYFVGKLHNRLCNHCGISNDFDGRAEKDPYKLLMNELEIKIYPNGQSVLPKNPGFNSSHPCYDWLY